MGVRGAWNLTQEALFIHNDGVVFWALRQAEELAPAGMDRQTNMALGLPWNL